MMHPILVLTATLMHCLMSLAGETKPAAEIGEEAPVPANIDLVTSVSNDKQAATVLFGNLLNNLIAILPVVF